MATLTMTLLKQLGNSLDAHGVQLCDRGPPMIGTGSISLEAFAFVQAPVITLFVVSITTAMSYM
eukprot:SAG31_NODE_5549_length_2465_cov_1.931530_1_plen_64_part_10